MAESRQADCLAVVRAYRRGFILTTPGFWKEKPLIALWMWEPKSCVSREVELASHVVRWTVFSFSCSQQLVPPPPPPPHTTLPPTTIRTVPNKPEDVKHHVHLLTAGSVDTAFRSVFPTTVERASCGVHMLLCSEEFPRSLSICCSVCGGLFPFCRSDGLERAVHTYPLPPSLPSPINGKRFLWTFVLGLHREDLIFCVSGIPTARIYWRKWHRKLNWFTQPTMHEEQFCHFRVVVTRTM